VEETVRRSGARTLITLIDGALAVPRPAVVEAARHLVIGVSDIVEELEGHVLPQTQHVADLLGFASAWDRSTALVVHCFAGVSRSTAAAFIIACALAPDMPESQFARAIRANSRTANPNRRLVALADSHLGRGGRMLRAVAAMGAPIPTLEAEPFSFALPFRGAS
jgi:predicted protein tyrosine phosphatase